jgi:hypothetical protein
VSEGEVATTCSNTCPTCARLCEATLGLVAASGLEALTDARLADAAGLTLAELHAHYLTAADCLYDTYDAVALSIYEDFERAFATEPGWRDALRLAGTTLLDRMAARPAEARLCFAEVIRGDHELLRRREASRRRLHVLFVRELGRRRDQAELFEMQLELLIGAGFQAIAAAVAGDRIERLPTLNVELESRALVFESVAV